MKFQGWEILWDINIVTRVQYDWGFAPLILNAVYQLNLNFKKIEYLNIIYNFLPFLEFPRNHSKFQINPVSLYNKASSLVISHTS